MALVAKFRIEGVRLWFYSNDHEPPHFHAKRAGQWEIRVHFLLPREEMLEIKWETRPVSAKVRRQLCRLAENHREALLGQWESVQVR